MRGRGDRRRRGPRLRSHNNSRPRQLRQRRKCRRHTQHSALAQPRALRICDRRHFRAHRQRHPCRRGPHNPPYHGSPAARRNDRPQSYRRLTLTDRHRRPDGTPSESHPRRNRLCGVSAVVPDMPASSPP